jgi:hypothetical protein
MSRNSTVSTYAAAAGIIVDEDVASGIRAAEKEVSNFDHMSAILKDKGKKEGEIFLIDGDIEALKGLINLIETTPSEDVRIGVLFRVAGHTTPFCIEKKFNEENELETVSVYRTDSVVMDIDQREEIRALVNEVATVAPIYSLGFEDRDGSILRDYKRQSDVGSCATYSLFDVEEMIKDSSFSDFVASHHNTTDAHNIFDINALPAVFMATIQSINGIEEAGERIRNGLRHFIERSTIPTDQQIEINGEITNLVALMIKIEAEQIPNPVIDIMNETNLKHYNNAHGDEVTIYDLDSHKLQTMKMRLEDKIFGVALEQYEKNGSEISESEANSEIAESEANLDHVLLHQISDSGIAISESVNESEASLERRTITLTAEEETLRDTIYAELRNNISEMEQMYGQGGTERDDVEDTISPEFTSEGASAAAQVILGRNVPNPGCSDPSGRNPGGR